MPRFRNLLAIAAGVMLLSGCAAGAPDTKSDATATTDAAVTAVVPAAQATTAATATVAETLPTAEPTETARPRRTPTPTETPEPARPTRTPTESPPEQAERPEPPPPDESGLSTVIERGQSGRREVALTFDAGADRGKAEQILDTLQEYGVIASFGITGMWAEENPDLVQRMVDDGHMLFNHTYSHDSLTGFSTGGEPLTKSEIREELEKTDEIVRDETGYEMAPYFRPPYADLNDTVLRRVAEFGYWITLQYSCDSLGWNGATVDEIVEKCGDNAEPGEILLLHVGQDSLDAEALPGLIESLQSNDFAFVTAEEMLQP